tara:strand:- start:2047 stop:2676 length:630 start_codon:yes stop_codon:yes gene_type:complete
MAFLQLKMSHHIDKTLNFQLRDNPINIKGKTNNFEKLEYNVPCTNVGDDYYCAPYGGKEPIKIEKGSDFDFKCSSALFNKLVDFSKGELCEVTMKRENEKTFYNIAVSSVKWNKPVSDGAKGFTQSYGYDSVKSRDGDRSLEIKWGMAFNNATRLVANIDDINPGQKAILIKEIMPEMFDIACGMKPLTQPEPVLEVVKNNTDDDEMPF